MEKIVSLNGAQILYNDNRSRIEEVDQSLKAMDSSKVDGARISEDGKYLYLTSKDVDVAGPYGPFSGTGGGGGSDNDAKLTVINQSGELPSAIITGGSYVITLMWTSIENGTATGPGTIVTRVNNELKNTDNVAQGVYSTNVSPYLVTGDNNIKLTITDIYGNTRTIAFSVKVVSYSLASTFDASQAFKGEINYAFTARGEGTKTMHFVVDGREVATKTVTTAGRADSIAIPKQKHGAHILEAFFTTTLGSESIKSNVLTYDLICYEEGNDKTIITSPIKSVSISQYSTIAIQYYVFNAVTSTVDVEYYVDGELINSLTGVDRTLQTWTKRADESGTFTYVVKSGDVSKTFTVEVTKVELDIAAETQGLTLHLSSEGRSNNEPEDKRTVWEYNDIKAQFENFNWRADGWVSDDDGFTVMRVKDDARITIPYKPFSTSYTDIKRTGKTLEFEFATSSVFDYSADLISCYSNGRGFKITAQQALFASSTSSVSAQYKENEHVRVAFVINNTSNNNLIYCYINGVISSIIMYPSTEIFYQNPEVEIKIGSSDAVIDIYRIRIYDRALNRFQVVNNWISDMQDGQKLLEEYTRNLLYDDNDNLSLDKLKVQLPELPYMVVYTDEVTDKNGELVGHLSQSKGEKLLVSGYYVDPVNPQNSFSWKNGEIDVQGTSSQAYPIKNFKIKIKRSDNYLTDKRKKTDCSGFIMTQRSEEKGEEVTEKKYPLRGYDADGNALSIKENTFVFKADFASSEGCNNVELVKFYNDICTRYIYMTPPQTTEMEEDNKEKSEVLTRQGIDGFPIVWFEKVGGEIRFIGKYNFNNHKGTDDTYGFSYHGEVIEEDDDTGYLVSEVRGVPDESWEVTDNNSDLTLWKRVAGDATKTLIKDVQGKQVTYEAYVSGDNFTKVKEQSLTPLFNGTHENISNENYSNWVTLWQSKYEDVDAWIEGFTVTSINDSGDAYDSTTKPQRNFIIDTMKADIRTIFTLTEETVQISAEEDLLGEYAKGESVAHPFEVRFPSEWYDAHVDTNRLPEIVRTERFVNLQKWVVSTDPDNATNEDLESPVTYSDVEYTQDTSAYRLAKFRAEFNKYFNVNDTLFYYIYTEVFLMIDSRVKNAFPTYFAVTHEVEYKDPVTGEVVYEYSKCKDTAKIKTKNTYYLKTDDGYVVCDLENTEFKKDADGNNLAITSDDRNLYLKEAVMTEEETVDGNGWPLGRWCWLPYDMDTGIGINNEGLLVFDYSLEDTEALVGSKVVKIGEDPNGVPVYNGSSSVIWNNVRKCFPDEITAMYKELRSGALFNYDTIEGKFEDHQRMWSAAIFNEDAYYKYVKPLLENGENRLGMCLGSKEEQRKYWLFNRFRFLDSKYVAGDAEKNAINFRVNKLSGDKTIYVTPYIDLYIKMKEGEAWQSTTTKVYRNQELPIYVDADNAGDTEAYIYSADQLKEVRGLNQSLQIDTLDISKAVNLQHLDVSSSDNVNGNTTLSVLSVGANKLLRTIDARNCRALGDKSKAQSVSTVDLSNCEQLEEAYFNGTALPSVKLPKGGRLRIVYLPSTITTLNIEDQEKIKEIQILDNDGNWDVSNIETLTVSNVNAEVQTITVDIINSLKEGSFLKFRGFDITFDDKDKFETFVNKLYTFNGTDAEETNKANIQGILRLTASNSISYEFYNKAITTFRDLKIDASVTKTVKFYDYSGSAQLDTQFSTDNSSGVGSVTYNGVAPTKTDTQKIHYVFDGWSLEVNGELQKDILTSVDRDLILFAHFEEVPIYYVNFYDYNGETHFYQGYTYGTGDVEYVGTTPAYSDDEFGDVAFLGWGTVKYGTADLEYKDGKLIGVDRDIEAYAMMDWPVVSFEITTPPKRLNYWPEVEGLYEGDYVDLDGMVVTAVKHTPIGNPSAILPSYNHTPTTRLTKEDTILTISILGRVDGETKLIERTLPLSYTTEMEVLTQPDRNVFFLNEDYPIDGLSLKFTFDNGETETVKPFEKVEGVCSWSPETIDEERWNDITVNYKGWTTVTKAFGIKEVLSFEDTDWETISLVTKEGLAPNWWSVGDCKSVTPAKTAAEAGASDSTVWNTNLTQYRILGFNHNKEIESPDRDTISLGFAGFRTYLTGFETIDYIPTAPPSDSTIRKGTYAVPSGEEGYYDVYYYNKDNGINMYKVGRGKYLKPYESPYSTEAIQLWVESAYNGSYLSSPSDGTELSGIKYSWNKGCTLKDNCTAFYNALPDDLKNVIVEVTKNQRDNDFTEYPFELDSSSNDRYSYRTVIKSQKEKVYIPSWMELTGMGKSGLFNTGTVTPADESISGRQFQYYKDGGKERRIRLVANGSSIYTIPYPTRSYEAFRWIPDSTSMNGRFINYYAYVDYAGDLQDVVWSYSDSLSALTPFFTV